MRFDVLALFASAALPAVIGLPSLDQQQVLGLNGMERDAMMYEHVSHPAFTDHSLRLKPTLGEDSVKQYFGFLDIAEDKHLFFWFSESRSSPSSDPLVMWLNGGPGGSCTTGPLFEHGPCTVNKTEDGTSDNPCSWNTNANIIFLEQPANVGYSSSSDSAPIRNTPVAAQDVYAFLQLFVRRFEEYAALPLYLAAESNEGHYAPYIASTVYHKNKDLAQAPSSDLRKINLESVMIGNGLSDPLIQMPSVAEYACDGPFAVFDTNSRQCRSLRRCERMVEAYEETPLGDEYMNRPEVKVALSVDPHTSDFVACKNDINFIFFSARRRRERHRKALLTELVDNGIRLLIYTGNADMKCDYLRESQWIVELPSKDKYSFGKAPLRPWTGWYTHLLDMLGRWIHNIPLAD
ncbi:Alpha/Beta hydrolase protein [Mycena epipterygia]|nr:Alpha/Beta hydrolase protein [Mycena epipterygia]